VRVQAENTGERPLYVSGLYAAVPYTVVSLLSAWDDHHNCMTDRLTSDHTSSHACNIDLIRISTEHGDAGRRQLTPDRISWNCNKDASSVAPWHDAVMLLSAAAAALWWLGTTVGLRGDCDTWNWWTCRDFDETLNGSNSSADRSPLLHYR